MDEEPPIADDSEWLNDVWSFYVHEPDNPDWTLESYKRLGNNVSSVTELWQMLLTMRPYVHIGMFFVMREHVFPCWDDKSNINGGCLSLKVPCADAADTWFLMVKRLLGETMVLGKGEWDVVNGLSISPKRGFCIIKIWLSDETMTDTACFALPPGYSGEVVYRSNRENITLDSSKQSQKS